MPLPAKQVTPVGIRPWSPASLAQLAERRPLKPRVAGSIPACGTCALVVELVYTCGLGPHAFGIGGSTPSKRTLVSSSSVEPRGRALYDPE